MTDSQNVFASFVERRSGVDRRRSVRGGPDRRRSGLGAVASALALSAAGAAEAAQQGTLGATSSGSIKISLIKAPTLQVADAAVSIAAGKAALNELAVCVTSQNAGAIQFGILQNGAVHPLDGAPPRGASPACAGEHRAFILPVAASGTGDTGRIVTLLASPF